ncbi:IclR family transcriptional regulator [Mycobacterium sp. NPDC003449]
MGDDDVTGAARNRSSSLRRALSLLDFLADGVKAPGGATLAEVAEGAGLNKSTALRLLEALGDTRLVQQDPTTRRWTLGPRTAYLGQAYLERLDIRPVIRPAADELARATGETVHVVVPEPPDVVYVDKIESPRSVRMISRIGSRQPMHSSGVGKAVLAFASAEVWDAVIAGGLAQRTPRTITDPDELRAEMGRIRARGYAVDDIENEADIRCVAAPVLDHTGHAVAALSVAGPSMRVTTERVPDLASHVTRAAKAASGRLGGFDVQSSPA